MSEHDQASNAERLPESEANRLLTRASEIEAARGTDLSVDELREVARQAGIAPSAFDEALSELRARGSSMANAAPTPKPRPLLVRFWPVAAIVGLLLFLILIRST